MIWVTFLSHINLPSNAIKVDWTKTQIVSLNCSQSSFYGNHFLHKSCKYHHCKFDFQPNPIEQYTKQHITANLCTHTRTHSNSITLYTSHQLYIAKSLYTGMFEHWLAAWCPCSEMFDSWLDVNKMLSISRYKDQTPFTLAFLVALLSWIRVPAQYFQTWSCLKYLCILNAYISFLTR